ncbi:MAG: glycerol-3-phosphate 1-O-acyltransferase PlsY [candidate division KSB1 bacterium]|nr:glycerol-3-phosphate 1-O-acyltransferase PlsY [candidate division KSB1 bacterium]
MIGIVAAFIIAYVIGSFPTSILTGKLLRGIDIREHGSGNAGGTNVFRVLGAGPGLFVMAFDVFKGFAATWWVSRLFLSMTPLHLDTMMIIVGCGVVAGHIWTLFAHFRGGKGVGTAAGMLLAMYPMALLFCLVVFALMFIATRIMSLASMSAAVTLPVTLSVFRYVCHVPVSTALYVFSFIIAALIVFTHRSNIKRLLNGTENKFGTHKES